MPRSTNPAGYSDMFPRAIEAVLEFNQPFTLTLKDNKEAQMIRFRFYSFLKTCRNLPDSSNAHRFKKIGKEGYYLIFTIKDNKLTIDLRDNTRESQVMEQALNEYLGQMERNSSPAALAQDIDFDMPQEESSGGEEPENMNEFLAQYETKKSVPTTEELMERMKNKGKKPNA